MKRSYKYRLHPTKVQSEELELILGQVRVLYNAALEQRISAYKRLGKTVSLYDQFKDLTALRAADPAWRNTSVLAQRSALQRLDNAYKGFFRRVKIGANPGFPRFRGENSFDSFEIGSVIPVGNRVQIPKVGAVSFNLYRPVSGIVKNVTIRRNSGKWFVCFTCDLGGPPPKAPISKHIGIDLGIIHAVTLSNGKVIENPRFFRHGEVLLARRQQSLSRKTKGSRSYKQAQLLVRKAFDKIRNQRSDYARKVAAQLCSAFDLIAYEDLNIRKMAKGNLAKSVYDVGWGILIRALSYKAESAGKTAVAVNPAWTSQICSACGVRVIKTLEDRMHICACGLQMSRDLNAAINIDRRGQRLAATNAEA